MKRKDESEDMLSVTYSMIFMSIVVIAMAKTLDIAANKLGVSEFGSAVMFLACSALIILMAIAIICAVGAICIIAKRKRGQYI